MYDSFYKLNLQQKVEKPVGWAKRIQIKLRKYLIRFFLECGIKILAFYSYKTCYYVIVSIRIIYLDVLRVAKSLAFEYQYFNTENVDLFNWKIWKIEKNYLFSKIIVLCKKSETLQACVNVEVVKDVL